MSRLVRYPATSGSNRCAAPPVMVPWEASHILGLILAYPISPSRSLFRLGALEVYFNPAGLAVCGDGQKNECRRLRESRHFVIRAT